MAASLSEKYLEDNNIQSIGILLDIGKNILKEIGNNRAEDEALLLMSYLLNKSKSEIFLNRTEAIPPEKSKKYIRWLKKRKKGVPIQHITGYQNFMGLEFAVSKNVFIPRLDTEILVEEIIRIIENITEAKCLHLMDLGTGSGIIPISICHYFRNESINIDFHAVDISVDAIKLAKKNARLFNCWNRVNFYHGNLFQPFSEEKYMNYFDGIISNPPYISRKEWKNLSDEVRLFDPPDALLGGENGIDFYHIIVKKSSEFLKPGGFLALEIGNVQKKSVCNIINNSGDFQEEILTFRDYHQNDRVIIAYKKK